MRSGSTVLLTAINVTEPGSRRTRPAACAMRSRTWAMFSAMDMNLTSVRLVEHQHTLEQHVGAVLHILRTRELLGRMADAADAGNKDHAYRPDGCDLLRVMTGAAGHELGGEAERSGALIDQLLEAFIGQCRMVDDRLGEAEAGLVQLGQAFGFVAELGEEAGELGLVEVAQFQSKDNFSGNHVVRPRLDLDPTDRAYLPAGHACDDL